MLFCNSIIRDHSLSKRQATIIGGNLSVEIHGKVMLLQGITDQVKQELILPDPA
jgi:hypothetical protein